MSVRKLYKVGGVLLVLALTLSFCSREKHFIHNSGFVFGTVYNLKYKHDKDLSQKVRTVLDAYDDSVSTYNKESVISRINRNETHVVDSFFVTVFEMARTMNTLSDGYFDITISSLSNLWRFNRELQFGDTITNAQYDAIASRVDSVLQFTGMDMVDIVGDSVVKKDSRIKLEMCALAEGYGIDLAAYELEKNGVEDYMVEIGGELHVKGKSPSGDKWRIAIDSPTEGSTIFNRTSQHIIAVTDCAISTSGTYRQYYYTEDGRRISHTINPITGYPVAHDLLSVTVVGPNTMTTDALATVFMVMGKERAIELAEKMKEVEAFFIYDDGNGEQKELMTKGFEELIVK